MTDQLCIPAPIERGRPYYYLCEATVILGYQHPGTVRAKHLANPEDAKILGKRYHDGKIILDKAAVHRLAERLAHERAARGEWRSKNLGKYLKRGVRDE